MGGLGGGRVCDGQPRAMRRKVKREEQGNIGGIARAQESSTLASLSPSCSGPCLVLFFPQLLINSRSRSLPLTWLSLSLSLNLPFFCTKITLSSRTDAVITVKLNWTHARVLLTGVFLKSWFFNWVGVGNFSVPSGKWTKISSYE